ncbi:MAG: hypothetical protein KGZ80_10365 [Methylomonas sp.]|nr:hypothetical protein [Methylomonas sp.]
MQDAIYQIEHAQGVVKAIDQDTKQLASALIDGTKIVFGTTFTDEDRLFFDQIKARATSNSQVIQTALANPLDKFQLGVRKLIEDLMIQRMAENDQIVTRYMDDGEFQRTAFPILAKEIFEAVRAQQQSSGDGAV